MALDFIAGSCGGDIYNSFKSKKYEVDYLVFLGSSGIFVGYPFDTVKVSG